MTNNNDKYNVIMPQTDDKALCIQVERTISSEGYEENFLPRINKMIDEYDEIRLLIYYKKFQGWEEEAAKNDMETTARFGRKIAKMALVNPPQKEIFQSTIKKPILTGEIRLFEEKNLDKAIEWIKS